MQERINQEIGLLKTRFPDLEYRPDGQWIRTPAYPLPSGWNFSATHLAFPIPIEYPISSPYGIYVPAGIRFGGQLPNNYAEQAPTQPPFGGVWGIFSWTPQDGVWHATADITKGSNLLNWVLGFQRRFEEGV
jgi:hypothetical protein